MLHVIIGVILAYFLLAFNHSNFLQFLQNLQAAGLESKAQMFEGVYYAFLVMYYNSLIYMCSETLTQYLNMVLSGMLIIIITKRVFTIL